MKVAIWGCCLFLGVVLLVTGSIVLLSHGDIKEEDDYKIQWQFWLGAGIGGTGMVLIFCAICCARCDAPTRTSTKVVSAILDKDGKPLYGINY